MRALLARVEAEVPVGLAVPRPSQQEHSLAVGSQLSQLVEGVALSLGSSDSVLSCSCEPEGANA